MKMYAIIYLMYKNTWPLISPLVHTDWKYKDLTQWND